MKKLQNINYPFQFLEKNVKDMSHDSHNWHHMYWICVVSTNVHLGWQLLAAKSERSSEQILDQPEHQFAQTVGQEGGQTPTRFKYHNFIQTLFWAFQLKVFFLLSRNVCQANASGQLERFDVVQKHFQAKLDILERACSRYHKTPEDEERVKLQTFSLEPKSRSVPLNIRLAVNE